MGADCGERETVKGRILESHARMGILILVLCVGNGLSISQMEKSFGLWAMQRKAFSKNQKKVYPKITPDYPFDNAPAPHAKKIFLFFFKKRLTSFSRYDIIKVQRNKRGKQKC